MHANPLAPALASAHLIELEPELCRVLAGIIPFTTHSLHFPTGEGACQVRWLPRERTLLLPLVRRGEVLGMFMARGVSGRTVRRLMPHLPALVELSLDNLALTRQSRLDPLTGLALPYVLLQRLCHDVDSVRASLAHADTLPADHNGAKEIVDKNSNINAANTSSADTASTTPADTPPQKVQHKTSKKQPDSPTQTPPVQERDVPMHRACAGLIYIHWYDKDSIASHYGHTYADTFLQALSRSLSKTLGEEALAARAADDAFTVLLPSGSPVSCHSLAQKILRSLSRTALVHPASKKPVRVAVSVGYALYPQDIDSRAYRIPTTEQARMLLARARLAATMGEARAKIRITDDAASLMGFGHIVPLGGIVKKSLPLGQLLISLGRQCDVHESMRFSMYTQQHGGDYKGELVITKVQESSSVAEILHMADPASPPAAGDCLRLVAASSPLHERASKADAAQGLLPHGEFLRLLHSRCKKHSHFSMILLRLAEAHASGTDGSDPVPQLYQWYKQACACSPHAASCQPVLAGRYGENSLALLLPAANAPEDVLHAVCRHAQDAQLDVAIGAASYPYLQFHKEEILDCCRKALELALLLPCPRVGVFGSLALNISADKRYAQGDVFGAVDEYKTALLADADNTLAWNSLGACMAALARPTQARRYFQQALKRAPEDPTTLYNLGNVCQSLEATRAAARYYRKCIANAPEHYFAHIRLGQLAEKAGRTRQAHMYFTTAATLEDQATERAAAVHTPPQHAATEQPSVRNSVKMPEQSTAHCAPAGLGAARRHLARLALRRRKQAEARELLHEALQRNPQDTAALSMLAHIYLDSNEDPGMAELLARKCVGLMPLHRPYRALLARALRALGREKDAQKAES